MTILSTYKQLTATVSEFVADGLRCIWGMNTLAVTYPPQLRKASRLL